MHKFSDTQGREWGVELNGYTIQKVHQDCGVFLTDLADTSGGQSSLIAKLHSPPFVLLVQVLWSLCEKQAGTAGVKPDDFAAALSGDTLEKGAEALYATVTDFFTSPGQRAALASLIAKMRETATIIEAQAAEAIEKLDPNTLAKITTESFSNRAEYADLTPANGS